MRRFKGWPRHSWTLRFPPLGWIDVIVVGFDLDKYGCNSCCLCKVCGDCQCKSSGDEYRIAIDEHFGSMSASLHDEKFNDKVMALLTLERTDAATLSPPTSGKQRRKDNNRFAAAAMHEAHWSFFSSH
mmetsp:Transcript_23801/g.49497  ORF Transcript_23801/g.49497 Transcript_23801/m.49497 type:complete len:128 (-) Transcript_23801:11-394(-)